MIVHIKLLNVYAPYCDKLLNLVQDHNHNHHKIMQKKYKFYWENQSEIIITSQLFKFFNYYQVLSYD
jgi:hypothetical protein